MNITLLSPPHWVPSMPHLALPTLTAYLRAQGVEVEQRDLNVEVFDHILTRPYLEQVIQHMRRGPQDARRFLLPQESFDWALAHGPVLADQVEPARDIFQSNAFFDSPASLHAFSIIVQSLALASLPFYPSSLELTRFVPPVPVDNSAALISAVRDPAKNLFLDLFRSGIVRDLSAAPPDVIGISISTMDQMFAAMTLCYLLKEEAGLSSHITLGGPHISMLRQELGQVSALWSWFDSAIVFSGQQPLLRLVEAVNGNGDLSAVPNLIYHDRDLVHVNPVCKPLPITELPMPDFDGLLLDKYLTPHLILPMITTHGCYYGKCAFCNQGYGGPERFSQLDAQTIVQRMIALHERYGTSHIFFSDEAITPSIMREMSKLLEAAGTPVEWIVCARFEKQLTRSLLAQMVRGGCRMLLFGLESGADRMIEKIAKGTHTGQVSRILRQGAEMGIWNHLFFFFGFPGETLEDAQDTVNLVYKHQQHIHSASPGTFLLERYAPAHLHWQKYGIQRIIKPPDKDLAIYFDYQVSSGMDEVMAERVVDSLLGVLPEKQFGQYYIHDSYRFLYASYLARQGHTFPAWLLSES